MARRRCEWCGVFVPASQQPLDGVNAYGESRRKLLCDECGSSWLHLSEQNQKWLVHAGPGMAGSGLMPTQVEGLR